MTKDYIVDTYNKFNINANKYADYILDKYNNKFDENHAAAHHIFLYSIFGDNYNTDDNIVALNMEEHTMCHRLLVEDNLDKFESGNITQDLIKIYKSYDMRFQRTSYAIYDKDWYDSHLEFFIDSFNKFLSRSDNLELDLTSRHHAALSAINYYFNKDMVQKMKENSVLNGDKQRWKTLASNTKRCITKKLLALADEGTELTKDSWLSLCKKPDQWWKLLHDYGYYILHYGFPRDKFNKLVAEENKLYEAKFSEHPEWEIKFNGFDPDKDVYPRLDEETEEKLTNYLSNQ